jgi:hypothetical protein
MFFKQIFQATDIDGDTLQVESTPHRDCAAYVLVQGRSHHPAQSVYLSPPEARELAAALLEVAGDE